MRLLEKSPNDRYPSASAVKERLEAALRAETREDPRSLLCAMLADAGFGPKDGAQGRPAVAKAAGPAPVRLSRALVGFVGIGVAFAAAAAANEAGNPEARIARPVGCEKCRDTGYVGRQGIYEVLVSSRAVQEHIVPTLETNRIREVAMREGMRTLRLSGATRVARGETTIEEVMRVAPQIDP